MLMDGIIFSKMMNEYAPENLKEIGEIETTIEGLDIFAPDWVEQAAEKVGAVSDDAYVKLNRGILTVNQIDALLDSIPLEFSYIDNNNQFLYYNQDRPASEMLAPSHPESVGQPLGTLHPEQLSNYVTKIVQQLRAGDTDCVRIAHPAAGGSQFLVHNYQRIQDPAENYMGINEFVVDLKPIIDWYLKQTKQKLVPNDLDEKINDAPIFDGLSSASTKENPVDGISSASQKF